MYTWQYFLLICTGKKKTGFPGINEKFKKDKDFINPNIVWLNNKKEIYNLIKKNDLIILGNCRGED